MEDLKPAKSNYTRGKHPNSRRGKKAVTTNLTLKPGTRVVIEAIGDGNMSEGVDRMADVLFKAKTVIQYLLEGHKLGTELGEQILNEIEALEIDRAYEELKDDFPKSKHGAYIV